jgi:hypothetical protein
MLNILMPYIASALTVSCDNVRLKVAATHEQPVSKNGIPNIPPNLASRY